MLNTWGKLVKNLRIRSWVAVDDYPQNLFATLPTHNNPVYNHLVLPVLPTVFTRTFPQHILHNTPPFKTLFSPLSTPPITISTNL